MSEKEIVYGHVFVYHDRTPPLNLIESSPKLPPACSKS